MCKFLAKPRLADSVVVVSMILSCMPGDEMWNCHVLGTGFTYSINQSGQVGMLH